MTTILITICTICGIYLVAVVFKYQRIKQEKLAEFKAREESAKAKHLTKWETVYILEKTNEVVYMQNIVNQMATTKAHIDKYKTEWTLATVNHDLHNILAVGDSAAMIQAIKALGRQNRCCLQAKMEVYRGEKFLEELEDIKCGCSNYTLCGSLLVGPKNLDNSITTRRVISIQHGVLDQTTEQIINYCRDCTV